MSESSEGKLHLENFMGCTVGCPCYMMYMQSIAKSLKTVGDVVINGHWKWQKVSKTFVQHINGYILTDQAYLGYVTPFLASLTMWINNYNNNKAIHNTGCWHKYVGVTLYVSTVY